MDKLVEKLVFGRSGLNSSVFEKLLISYSCISFMKYYALRSFLHKIALFFKNLFFLDFRSIEPVFWSIEIAIKNFQFLIFWPIYSSMHHLCLGFTCITLFLYPSYSFAVISLIVFTHNMHTLCYIGYSTWSKNWLINFWVMYFLVYAFFYVWTVENIFLKRYDG